jgi:aryl-alcohol dehydrogenase-like predicted oxidoreductase
MQYRTHQGERISEIGIGCYGLTGVYGPADADGFIKLIERAYDLGVTFFDTADIYGPAEEILGRAVAPFREQVWIASKVGGGIDGKPNCSAEHVLASCEESLLRLQTDYIDLYQIHFNDPQTLVEETIGALEKLQSQGKIRYYGIGHLPPNRIQAFLKKGRPFSALFELSAAARSAREHLLALCRRHQVAAIAFSTTGRGLLTGKIDPGHQFNEGDIRRIDPLFQRERFSSGLRVAERLAGLGKQYSKTPVQVAIAWVLAQPGIVCALTGPSTIPHLEENLQSSGWTIPGEELAKLEQFLQYETGRLHDEQLQSIHAILRQPLKAENAFTDLVYVLEVLIEMRMAEEVAILPIFQDLLTVRGRTDKAALQIMASLQAEIRALFLDRL